MSRSRDIADAGVKVNYLDNVSANIPADVTSTLALKAPLASPTFTGTTDISSGATFPADHVIKVVQDTLVTADCFTTGAGDWTDIGLEVDITPEKTGNKVWIQAVVYVGASTGRDAKARCIRDDANDILVATGLQTSQVSSFGALGADTDSESHDRVYPLILNFVDSPGCDTLTNYKIQLYHALTDDGNAICYNRSYLDTDAERSARVSSTLIAMELST